VGRRARNRFVDLPDIGRPRDSARPDCGPRGARGDEAADGWRDDQCRSQPDPRDQGDAVASELPPARGWRIFEPFQARTRRTMFLPNHWYVAANPGELGRKPLARIILNEPVLLYRSEDGTPVALEDRCPHRRLPLSMGKLLDGDILQCHYHG